MTLAIRSGEFHMGNRQLTLRSEEDIEQALQRASWLARPMVEKVKLDLPAAGDDEQQQKAGEIKRLFNDCGCLWGAPGFILGFGIYYLIHLQGAGFSWATLGVSALAGILSALAAKFLALLWSFWQLRRTLSELKMKKTQTQTTPDKEETP